MMPAFLAIGLLSRVASYGRAVRPGAVRPTPCIRQMGDLRWRDSGRGTLGGLPVLAHTYQDKAGGRVVLLQADRSFPTAGRRPPSSRRWHLD
jgi:hypothetical protein